MIFSEIYGSYYKAMTEILKIAVSSGGSAALKDIRLWARLSGNNLKWRKPLEFQRFFFALGQFWAAFS